MVDIREYLRKKEKNEKKDSKDFKREIRAHRLKVILRSGCVIGVIAALTVTAVTLLKNQTYSGYTVVSAIDRNQVSGSTLLSYQNGFLTYSKDGISYTDYKGNAMWNQTYDMQSPCVSVRSGWVAVGDYNGNLIYDISQDGTSKQIDTNLPVKSLSVAANGVVAAILEDGDVTWINVYNPTGEKAVGIKTTMQKSGIRFPCHCRTMEN